MDSKAFELIKAEDKKVFSRDGRNGEMLFKEYTHSVMQDESLLEI